LLKRLMEIQVGAATVTGAGVLASSFNSRADLCRHQAKVKKTEKEQLLWNTCKHIYQREGLTIASSVIAV